MASNGSVQQFKEIPEYIRKLYRTVWEIPQKHFINLAVGRAPYICQSQSLNIYMSDLSFEKINNMHFYGWRQGLKTGLYYLRSRPAVDAIKFTVDMERILADENVDSSSKVINKVEGADHLDKRDSSELKDGEMGDDVKPKKKMKTIPLEDYQDDMCENCGS